jgi:hypothetical protein
MPVIETDRVEKSKVKLCSLPLLLIMVNWAKHLDAFIEFVDRDLLPHAGKIRDVDAKTQVLKEFIPSYLYFQL